MKNKTLLLILLTGIFLSSCTTPAQRKINKKCDESLARAENSPVEITSIFLDFQFGMSEKAYDKHLNNLRDKNIVKSQWSHYEYMFNISPDIEPIPTMIKPKFYNDQLYQLSLYFLDFDGKDSELLSIITNLYQEKAKQEGGYETYIYKYGWNKKSHYFIKKNLVISIPLAGIIDYTNYPMLLQQREEPKREEERKIEQEKKRKEQIPQTTISDL